MRVVLIGEEAAGLRTLTALQSRPDEIVAVVTSPGTERAAPLWSTAQRFGLQAFPSDVVSDPEFAGWIRAQHVDLILNVHSLRIIDSAVLDAPRLGSFNLHPGPLPRYAGLNTVSWAIYNGEAEYGVTVHRMTDRIDAGPVAYQAAFPMAVDETPLTLSSKCVRQGITLLLRLLDDGAAGQIPETPQDLSQRRYFGREVPENGRICWTRPAKAVDNLVRACDYHPFRSPWGHPRARVWDRELTVNKVIRTCERATAPPGTARADGSDTLVACSDEWVVVRVGEE
jgi:methionyl-tRNA formyltransferase